MISHHSLLWGCPNLLPPFCVFGQASDLYLSPGSDWFICRKIWSAAVGSFIIKCTVWEKKNALVQKKETETQYAEDASCHLKSNQPPTVTFCYMGIWGSFCSSPISLLDRWLNDIKEKNKTWHVLYMLRLFSLCGPNGSNIEQYLLPISACICHIEFKLGCLFLAIRPLFKNPVLHMQSKYREVKPSTSNHCHFQFKTF